MVCIFAHPDDESFGPGGSIASFAKERDVYLICVTSGDAQEQFNHSDISDLGKARKQELIRAASILGVKKVDFLGYQDGTLSNNLYHEIAEKIQQKIEEYQPDTLLTFEPRGVSGHIDHIAVSMITTYVFYKLPYLKKLLYFCETKKMEREMREYFIYVPPGYESKDIGLTIDTTEMWETKITAMKEHQSQQKDVDWMLHILAKYPKEEHFLVLEK